MNNVKNPFNSLNNSETENLDESAINPQPRSQGFSLFVIGKAGKGPGTGRSHDFQHPDIVGVINYNNNELENQRWPPTQECPQNLSA